jgi:RecA-family ATPase
MVLSGFLPRGQLTIAAGAGGSGKSALAIHFAQAVEHGTAVGGIQATKGRALIFDGEMGEWEYVERLRAANLDADFAYVDAMGLDISKPDHFAWVEEQIREVRPTFVVFDSLRTLAPSRQENSADEMAPYVTALRTLSRRRNCGILTLHHMGHSEERERGSSTILQQCDNMFYLTSSNKTEVRKLEPSQKVRMKRPEAIYLHIGRDTGRVEGTNAPGDVKALEKRILECLPKATQDEIAEALDMNRTSDAFQKALRNLNQGGKVRKANGQYVAVTWEMV